MNTDKTKSIDEAADAIQRRFGIHALRTPQTATITREIAHISTSYPVLDRALGIGGIPGGHITELIGRQTSGMGTLSLKIMANAQGEGSTAVYVDTDATFDPIYAAACGVNVAALLLVRPKSLSKGFDIAGDLVNGKGVGVLVFDTGMEAPPPLATIVSRLVGILADSPCALIVLVSLPLNHTLNGNRETVSPYASLRLRVEKDHWLKRRREVSGYRARITILKNKLWTPSRPVTITICLH